MSSACGFALASYSARFKATSEGARSSKTALPFSQRWDLNICVVPRPSTLSRTSAFTSTVVSTTTIVVRGPVSLRASYGACCAAYPPHCAFVSSLS
eukprot:903309-Rhodomonas_salina.1